MKRTAGFAVRIINFIFINMRTAKLTAIATILVGLAACQKYGKIPGAPLSSVTIVHAMPAGHAIVPVFGPLPPTYYATRVRINYGSSLLFSPQVDSNALQIVPITDTVFTIFQGKMNLVNGGIYTFFLAGDTTKPDTMWVKDEIPVYSDSSVGVRFVNLAAGGKAISINLAGNDPTSQTEISSLGYLHISSFKKYLANSSVTGNKYKFEIHDQASGDSLTTYTWNYQRFKNNTIVIAGSTDPGSGIPLKTFILNNF